MTNIDNNANNANNDINDVEQLIYVIETTMDKSGQLTRDDRNTVFWATSHLRAQLKLKSQPSNNNNNHNKLSQLEQISHFFISIISTIDTYYTLKEKNGFDNIDVDGLTDLILKMAADGLKLTKMKQGVIEVFEKRIKEKRDKRAIN